ncbi:E3 ubiquitin-protein ligase ARIH2-like [Pimephales promelas]|nr:E3 ubiquitin-protein ligase ARIH2-like [Pimephales promelas]
MFKLTGNKQKHFEFRRTKKWTEHRVTGLSSVNVVQEDLSHERSKVSHFDTKISDPQSSVRGCPYFRACPGCKALLTHNGRGCPNIVCPHCGRHICFRCLRESADYTSVLCTYPSRDDASQRSGGAHGFILRCSWVSFGIALALQRMMQCLSQHHKAAGFVNRHVRTVYERAHAVTADLPETIRGQECSSTETFSEAPSGASGIRSRSNATQNASYETASALASRSSPEVDMATRHSPTISYSDLPSDLHHVEEPQFSMGRCIPGMSFPACCYDRCLCHGLGCHVQWTCCRGLLDRTPAPTARQLPRVAGFRALSAPLPRTSMY